MENSKKKKIILIASIGVVVCIILLGLILFLATDIFKSPQQLFYQYLPQNSQLLDVFSSSLVTSYKQKCLTTPYTSNGEISFNFEYDAENQDARRNHIK